MPVFVLVSVPYEITLLSNYRYLTHKDNPVSVPYEITLLSNNSQVDGFKSKVSVPYEITLLSNCSPLYIKTSNVSVPYEITLLSNGYPTALLGFLFQYLMKLHYSQTIKPFLEKRECFSTL